MSGRRWALIGCPLVALLLFLPTLRNDFVFDDRAIIVGNPLLSSLRDLPHLLAAPYWNVPGHSRTLYRPVTSTSFSLNRSVGGLAPRWFHLVNVCAHAAATLLVVLLALRLLPGALGPATAGLLFAVHPAHVEAVAGIVGRAEILAACGAIAMILAHRRALLAGHRATRAWIAVAWGAFLFAVGSKESALIAPGLAWLAERVPDATAPDDVPGMGRRRLILWSGYAAIAAGYLLARAAVLGALGIGAPIPFVDNPAASAGPLAGRLTALGCLVRYAGLLLWPARLAADYSYDQIPVIRSALDPMALGGLALLLATVAGGPRLLRRRPATGFALLWIAISGALTANLILFIGTLLAERLLYLPSVGFCLLIGAAVGSAADRRPTGLAPLALRMAVLGLCAAAAWRSWSYLPAWVDDFALYSSAARVSPRSARIRYNLGNAHLRAADYPAAAAHYRAALEIYPEFNDARVNLGMALLQERRPAEALGLLVAAAAREPRSAEIAVDLGNAHRALGHNDAAEEQFRRALHLDPGSAQAWNNLGSLALLRGEADSAVDQLRRAVELDPDAAIYRVNLADALNAAGFAAEADREFVAAASIAPDFAEAHRGLGEVALRQGRIADAEAEFRRAASPSNPSARACNFLGYLLAQRGDTKGAAGEYERALAIDPGLADAHASLGLLYAGPLGDPDKAVRHLEASLRIDPAQPDAERLRATLKHLRH